MLRSTEDIVDLHDKVLRGDGEGKLGLVALVTNLCLSVDKLQGEVHALKKSVSALELSLAKAKGWIAGATMIGSASGAVITWLLEHFVAKH